MSCRFKISLCVVTSIAFRHVTVSLNGNVPQGHCLTIIQEIVPPFKDVSNTGVCFCVIYGGIISLVCLSINEGCVPARTKGEISRGRSDDASSVFDNIQGSTPTPATLHLHIVRVMHGRVTCDDTNGVSFKYAPIQFGHGCLCLASRNSYVGSFPSSFSNLHRKTSNGKFIAEPLKAFWFGGVSNCNNFKSNN
jgi:hypothetical protein